MTELDTDPTRARSLVRDRLAAARGRLASAASAIPVRTDVPDSVPLTSTQARLWFLGQLEPDSTAYNVPDVLALRGPLDVPALLGALRDLAGRHLVLRSTIEDRDGGPVAVVGPIDSVPISVERPADSVAVAALLARERTRPFALHAEPPMRAVLLEVGEDEHILALTFHHIVTDAWTRGLVATELAGLYAARLELGAAPPAAPQYHDCVAWLENAATPAAESADLEWWAARLAGADGVLALPTDRPRPVVADWAGGAVPVEIPAEVVERVGALAAAGGASPFMVLLAAWQALLARLSGSDDVVVGVPEFGRHHPDAERVVGCFVNTLAMRTDLGGDPTGRELVDRVRETVLGAFAHHRTPFERIVDRLAPERGLSATPVVQVMLNVVDSPARPPGFAGLDVTRFDPVLDTVKLDLSLSLERAGRGYRGALTFRTDLFDRTTVERIARWYLVMLAELAAEPDRPVGAVALAEVAGPVATGRHREFAGNGVLHELVDRWIAERPDAVAVVGPDRTLTYAELDDAANRLAHRLIAAGVRTEEPVGVFAERGADLVVAMLAVLRAGGVYLPLDSSYPDERVAEMLASAGATVALADRALAPRVVGATVLVIDDPADDLGPVRREVRPDHLAYMIFTSGSTGRPKGVAVEHRNITHYLHAVLERLGEPVAGGRSFALVSTHAADLGLTNVLGPLATGGTAHLLDRETALDSEAYADYLDRHRIDVVKLVPSQLELLAAHGELAEVLPRRMLILAGEACPWTLLDRVRAARPDLAVQVHYGPTETTVAVLACAVEDVPAESRTGIVPIGVPLANAECFVVDAAGRPVPTGLPGELWIAGPGVAREYLGRPEETAARFVPDPVTGEKRCYRTGDRVRLNSAGLMEFLGRVDDQVKVRGFRVEPGEIAAALRAQPGVVEAVVLARGEAVARRLVAWITTGESTVDVHALKTALRSVLPDYLVPTSIVVLDAFPLNPNGKVDRAALPEPLPESSHGSAAPETPTELRIAGVWSELLAVPGIGVQDDFFALGGDSFTAVRAVRQIGLGLRVIDLFTHPTVGALAEFLDGGDDRAAPTLLHQLTGPARGETPTVTVLCVPYGGGLAAGYRPLAEQLAAELPGAALLAVELPGHDPAAPDEARLPLPDVVDRVLAELADRRTGPILVYGHCVGSALATELALRLEDGGRPLIGLVIGGSFPTAQLPGRLPAWWNRTLGGDRWRSDRGFEDALRVMGGLLEDEEEGGAEATAMMLASMRHDGHEARRWFTRELTAQRRRTLTVPVLCVIGQRDLTTELYQERFAEWGAFADRVELAEIPRAGHYFAKHQAGALAALIAQRVRDWPAGRVPEPLPEVTVVGRTARRNLREFYLLAAGQTVSLAGSALSAFALGVWVYQQTGRIADYALITMFALLPRILFAPVGGTIADRVDRRRVLLVCDALAAVLMLGLVVPALTGSLHLWQVALTCGLLSTIGAVQQPAYVASVAQLVPKPYLAQANAIAQVGTTVGTLLAPLAGAALMALLGLGWVIGLDLASFLVGALTLLAVRFPNRMFPRSKESFGKALTGGWRYLSRRRPLLIMAGFFVVVNYVGALVFCLTTPLVFSFGGTASVGVVVALSGVGGILGAVLVVCWGGTARRATGMVGFVIGVGLGDALLGLRPSVPLACLGGLLTLGSSAILNAHWQALLQTKVGPDLLGRVLATNQLLAVAMTPLAFLTAPLLSDWFEPLLRHGGPLASTVGQVVGVGPGRGTGLLVLLGGLFLVAWGVLGLRYRPLRYMEDDLPDSIAGAELPDDLDAAQAEADLLVADDSMS
ncbi:amino acid adenylation domain-containing protein [Solihabitans fulvus]|uniref:Amino acid adenylation domain-containing protein n=1 Tax=Solihabitans fulvus TaxID=1892852 RepID=A0A5B2XFB6_9PSEU|nr:non-ribosomal peptide synthetase/MFS transporter [Solihabitans fulvus]KAA2261601.1 amino acid adenylation domain-containing protein [Solihabitans fulvus]